MSAPNSESEQLLEVFSELIKCSEQIEGGAASASTSRVPAEKERKKVKVMKTKKKVVKEEGVGAEPKQKFSSTLALDEIDTDVFKLTGKRPLRSKIKWDDKVKKDLQDLYLCSFLEGHDADSLRKAYGL